MQLGTGAGFRVNNLEVVERLKFDERGLIPAIAQDINSGQVLMLAYMNQESLKQTLTGGRACYYSRSRQTLWLKGETSGNYQAVREIYYDCDGDTLLLLVEQTGTACHEGYFSCFHNLVGPDGSTQTKGNAGEVPRLQLGRMLEELYNLVDERKAVLPEGSYTTYLFEKGQDKILKKVGEESAETIIASKNNNFSEIVYEVSDLFYHLLVLLSYHNISLSDIAEELVSRRK